MLFEKWLQNLPTILVQRNANHGEAFRVVRRLERLKPRDLLLTSGTPGGPKIKQNHLAMEIRELYSLAVNVLESKVSGGLPLFFGLQSSAESGLISGGDHAGQCQKQK